MKDSVLSFLAGLTGPELAILGTFLAGVFSCGVGLGITIAQSLPVRRKGLYIAPHRTFKG